MAAAADSELTQDAVLRFLAERGGRARNADLLEHFRAFLSSPEPQRRARARECFKELVNAVATVRQEPGSGAKYVQLRKKYRSVAPAAGLSAAAASSSSSSAAGDPFGGAAMPAAAARLTPEPESGDDDDDGGGGGHRRSRDRADAAPEAGVASEPLEEGKGSDYAAAAWSTSPPEEGEFALSLPSPQQQQPPPDDEAPQPSQEEPEGGSGRPKQGSSPSPLSAVGQQVAEQEGPAGGGSDDEARLEVEDSLLCPPPASPAAAAATPSCGRKTMRERMLGTGSSPQGKRSALLSRGSGGGDSDSASLASSSAEEESGGGGGSGSSGGGSGSVALDPLEHEWMLCASDGCWEPLEALLSCEPALLCKRDFITGFTCLHWAAKHGRHELLALLVNFALRHRLPVNVNARTSGGYTALHLAAMHGHLEVVKLLVGAYDADVDVRDYSGRKASHYLAREGCGASEEVRSLVGAQQDEAGGAGAPSGGRWRLSRVLLPAHLLAYKLPHLNHGDEGDSGDLSRKITGSGRIKPRLNKIRFRTQIIHTTPPFRGDTEEELEEGQQEEGSPKVPFKLRPKSNVFG